MNSHIPLGYRFEPTDQELVSGYLYPWVIGSPLPWNGVVYKPLYGPAAEPWEVFAADVDGYWQTMIEGGATKSTTYVFTNLIRVRNSKKISRTAGGGTWAGQTGPKKVFDSDSGETVGYMRMLSFEHPDAGASSEFGHWIMHEYVLSGDVLKEIGIAGAGDMVVCKITKCVKNSGGQPRLFPPAISDDQETGAAGESWVQEVQETVCKKQKSCCGVGGAFTEVAAIPEVDDSWLLSALEHDGNIEIYSSGNDGGSFTEAAEIEHAGNFELLYGGNLGAATFSEAAAQSDSWEATASPVGFDDSFDIEALLARL